MIKKNYSTELRSFKVAAGTKFDLKTLKDVPRDFYVTIDGAAALSNIVFTESKGSTNNIVPLERLIFNIHDVASGYIVPAQLTNVFNTTVVPAGGQLNVGIYTSAQHDEITCSAAVVYNFVCHKDEVK